MTSPPPPPSPPPAAGLAAARARHWRATRRLTAGLLLAWGVVGFGVSWFARDLDADFFGWPFSFWVAAQGGIVVFVLINAVHARRMAALDRALREAAGKEPPRPW